MSRDFYINGESLVRVKGAVDTGIAQLSELGLTESAIHIRPDFVHQDINVDAWGPRIPADVQWFLADVRITMVLVHFDPAVLNFCVQESMGGAPGNAFGMMNRAGQRLGNNRVRFAQGYHYVGLNITSPVAGIPWRFFHSYLTGPPVEYPLGTERSLVVLNWRAIPYIQDPYQNGLGATNYPLWDNSQDT